MNVLVDLVEIKMIIIIIIIIEKVRIQSSTNQSFISNELYKSMLMKYTIGNMGKVGIITDEEKFNTYMWYILNKYDYQTVTISYLLKNVTYKSIAALCI